MHGVEDNRRSGEGVRRARRSEASVSRSLWSGVLRRGQLGVLRAVALDDLHERLEELRRGEGVVARVLEVFRASAASPLSSSRCRELGRWTQTSISWMMLAMKML
jgi:hypothetical protein